MKIKYKVKYLYYSFIANTIGNIYKNKNIHILTYHEIVDSVKDEYSVSIKDFFNQMNYLKINGYWTLKIKDVLNNSANIDIKKASIITFDDGYKSQINVASKMLNEFGYSAIFFVTTRFIQNGNNKYMSWSDIRELISRGFEVGLHSHNHNILSRLSLEDLREDIKECKNIFERNTGFVPYMYALPYGKKNSFSDIIINELKENGFTFIFTQINGPIVLKTDCYSIPRNNVPGYCSLKMYRDILNGKYDVFKYFLNSP